MKTILSFYHHSLVWTEPYHMKGYNTFELDILNDPSINVNELNYEWIHENVYEMVDGTIDGILSGPPCTDFTVSGAQYWPQKDADGRTLESLKLVAVVLEAAEVFQPDWWVLENPVGRLPKLIAEHFPEYKELLGAPTYFHPHEYAGYLDVDIDQANRIREKPLHNITSEDIEFIKSNNLYTKKNRALGKFHHARKKEYRADQRNQTRFMASKTWRQITENENRKK